MYKKYIFIFLFCITFCWGEEKRSDQLNQLFDDYYQFCMRTYPEWATYLGDHRYNDKLQKLADREIRKNYQTLRKMLEQLSKLDQKHLNKQDKLNYTLFFDMLLQEIDSQSFYNHYMPIGQQSGIHIEFPQIVHIQPLVTYADYQKYFSRLRSFAKQIDDVIANMQNGIKKGLVMPKFLMAQTLPQMSLIKDSSPQNSVFYSPLKKGNKLNTQESQKVAKELRRIIIEVVNPGYEKLYQFVKEEYLPKCRENAGVWALPDGDRRYAWLIKKYTTTNLTADEIHAIGLKEVKRIRQEMGVVMKEIGFKGSIDEFNNYIKTDSRFYYSKKENLMNGFREILRKMDTKLPELFGILPKAKYDLKEIEAYRARSAPQAYYYRAPEDGSRPGYFYVNTYNLPSRPIYTMTALALHEAVPGHHLQIAIAQELLDVPWFRKNLDVTGFIEGWGLYAESLGYETGMYKDKFQHYGALTFEMWRACRLVVDTGIHYKRWTREKAYEYMRKYTPNSDLDIRSEIDRYIAWPGQALAYKIGELKIKELRVRAEKKLGKNFNIRDFHDQLLKNGAIPLPLLEHNIQEWLNIFK